MSDSGLIIVALIGMVGSVASAGFAAWAVVRAGQARTQATTTHDLVNSRMTELLEVTRAASRAEGQAAGEQAQRDRASRSTVEA